MKASIPESALPDVTLVLSAKEAVILRILSGARSTTEDVTSYQRNRANFKALIKLAGGIEDDDARVAATQFYEELCGICDFWALEDE